MICERVGRYTFKTATNTFTSTNDIIRLKKVLFHTPFIQYYTVPALISI